MQFNLAEASAPLRRLPFVCVLAADGLPATSLSFASTDLLVGKNGAAEANFTGVVTEQGGGLYAYEFTQAELNTRGYVTLRVNKTLVEIARFTAQVIDHDPYGVYDCNVAMINGSSAAAVMLRLINDSCGKGVIETTPTAPTNAAGVCTFSAQMDSLWTEQTATHFNGRLCLFTSGAMFGSTMRIVNYTWDAANLQGRFTGGQMQELPIDGTAFAIL